MIDITVDYKDAVRFLTDFGEKQIPFAEAKAVNATGLDVQKAERAQIHSVFQLRRPEWADRSVKITHFAKKSEPWLTIGIHPPGGDQRADILAKFETDTWKTSITGGRVAIPVNAKRNKADIVPRGQRPRAIIAAGKAFILKSKNPNVQLIVRQVGRGKRRILETLYLLVQRVPLTPDLHFRDVAERTVNERWVPNFLKAFDDALRTAK